MRIPQPCQENEGDGCISKLEWICVYCRWWMKHYALKKHVRLPNLQVNNNRFSCWSNRSFPSGLFLTRLLSCAESVNITVLPNGTCELPLKQQCAAVKKPSNVLHVILGDLRAIGTMSADPRSVFSLCSHKDLFWGLRKNDQKIVWIYIYIYIYNSYIYIYYRYTQWDSDLKPILFPSRVQGMPGTGWNPRGGLANEVNLESRHNCPRSKEYLPFWQH